VPQGPDTKWSQDRLAGADAQFRLLHEHPVLIDRENRSRRGAGRRGNSKPMRFVSLHHHSTFSFLDGYALPEAHIRRAEELNMNALAMTEHGNVFSHVKLEAAASKSGVKPIFGCELYTGFTDKERRTQKKNHLTVIAMDAEGYRNLLWLVSESWGPGFYYEPTVDMGMLRKYGKGLAILSGCQGSARRYARAFPGRYFIEVQAFPELEKTRLANPILARIARVLKLPLIATMDCHYTVFKEREIQAVLHNIRPGEKKTLEEQVQDWGYDVPLCPPPNDRAIYRRLRGTGLSHEQATEAIVNTELLAQDCNVELPKLPMVKLPLPEGVDHIQHWREKIGEGWRRRGVDGLPRSERVRYRAQLRREVEVIEAKDFTDYFLIVADAVQWAKGEEILVGPARGSAAASLVCWLLQITEVNPMRFPDLVFERFIDWSRADLPDIDLDFDSDRRHEVREYLARRYGPEQVSNIGTFGYFKSKNSLDDAARVHRIPAFEINKIKDLLLERSSGDLRASATIEDTIGQFEEAGDVLTRYPKLVDAMDLEGNVKMFGVHAAGLVVSSGPITDVTSVIRREVNDREIDVVSMDKYDAERQGLLKLDFLGLSTMAMMAEALRILGMKPQDLYDLDFDDEEVIQGFRENDVVGIFQFEGRATRAVCGSLQPDSFKEVCDINALSRPGPLHNGAADAYIDIKKGRRKPELIHPLLDSITAGTNYQIVYQEQILRIVREIGGFDWTGAANIRKIISKKHGEAEFNRQWEAFWKGARERGVDEETARKIWGLCITAGAYAFNAAHTTSYGTIAYWTMWLKRKFPDVFYAASLSKVPDGGGPKGTGTILSRHTILRRDAIEHGIEIIPPGPSSGLTWSVTGKSEVSAGLTQIPGVGDKTAAAMVRYREEAGGVSSWGDYLAVKGIGPKTVERIQEWSTRSDPFGVYTLRDKIERGLAFVRSEGLPQPSHTALEIPYEEPRDILITWIGVGVRLNLRNIFEQNQRRGEEVVSREKMRAPELDEFMLITGYDGSELVNLRFTRFIYPKFRDAIWKTKLGDDLLLVRGVKPRYRAAREIQVHELIVLEDD